MSETGAFAALKQLAAEHDMLPAGCRVLCAVSGGADSICLLYQLTLLRPILGFELAAAHYNHRLRGAESDRDEAFVASFVRTCCGPCRHVRADGSVAELPAVTLVTGSGDVAGEAARTGRGIEETARQMRYDFLFQTARQLGCDRIATAHTADDNLETLLLHLLRGSGLRGLTGIAPVRGMLIRPLLTATRAQVEAFLLQYGLPHMEDSSNGDEAYTRNRLRHQVVPLLESFQPGLPEHVAQTMALLRADEEYLTAQAKRSAALSRPSPGGLSIDAAAVADLPDPLATRTVRLLLGQISHGFEDCAAAHLHSVVELCRGERPSAQVHLPHGLIARRVYGRLELTRGDFSPPLEETPLPLPGQIQAGGFQITVSRENYSGTPCFPHSFFLSCAKVERGLVLRGRRTGERLTRPGRPGSTVKKLMIDEKIPRHLRDSIPVFDCGGRVAAVAGLGADTAFLPLPGEEAWHIVCRPLTANTEIEKGSL